MCNCNLSRRDFIKSSVLSTSGIAALNSMMNTPEPSYGSYAAKKNNRDHTVIKVVYFAKPVPSWPCPDLDVDAEMRMINDKLADLKEPKTEQELNVDEYLHSWTNGLHRVIYYGNYMKDIEKMGRLMGFKVVREA